MKRIAEPDELMDDPGQARAYADEDFAEARELFLEQFARLVPAGFSGHVLDLGCGPADIPIALAERYAGVRIDALDAAEAMLAHARAALARRPQVASRVRLLYDHLPSSQLPARHYDIVLSNSLLHHLLDPAVLWQTVCRCAKAGAAVCIMDLLRPPDPAAVDALVAMHAAAAPEVLSRDFRNSLFAAYEVDEVKHQLEAAGLGGLDVLQVSDRHLAVTGLIPG